MTSPEMLLVSGQISSFAATEFEKFPDDVLESFDEYKDYIEEIGLSSLFEHPGCVNPQVAEDEKGKVYSFRIDENFGTHSQSGITTEVIVVDYDQFGVQTGRGVVTRHIISGLRETQPFVGWTETHDKFKGTQLAGRRLKYMNSLCLTAFEQPLRSAYNGMIEPEAVRVWEKLVEEGRAEFVDSSDDPHWRFKQTT